MTKFEEAPQDNIHPLPLASAKGSVRHVFVHDLVLDASVGAYDHERNGLQKIRINLDLGVDESGARHNDRLENVVCYDEIITGIRNIIKQGHIRLVETLAETIADFALGKRKVVSVRVRVEKLEAIADAESVGVEIERHKLV